MKELLGGFVFILAFLIAIEAHDLCRPPGFQPLASSVRGVAIGVLYAVARWEKER